MDSDEGPARRFLNSLFKSCVSFLQERVRDRERLEIAEPCFWRLVQHFSGKCVVGHDSVLLIQLRLRRLAKFDYRQYRGGVRLRL
jgi:hypothetical protein